MSYAIGAVGLLPPQSNIVEEHAKIHGDDGKVILVFLRFSK